MMSDEASASNRLAVLIGADNANQKVIEELLAEVARFGIAGVKRAYGDWTTQNLASWKSVLLDHSIQPMQQFANTKGKNATDSAMIIDAMDLLHSRRLEGFCIVSSDSDFTGLARRIREDGLLVIGFSERKTPKPFVVACDRFIYTDLLVAPPAEAAAAPKRPAKTDTELVALIHRAIEASSDDDGWAHLGAVGSNIAKQQPAFDSRDHGYQKLSDLVKAIPAFKVEARATGDGKAKTLYIRDARKRG